MTDLNQQLQQAQAELNGLKIRILDTQDALSVANQRGQELQQALESIVIVADVKAVDGKVNIQDIIKKVEELAIKAGEVADVAEAE